MDLIEAFHYINLYINNVNMTRNLRIAKKEKI